jgi:hypothetical protein
MTRRLYVDTAMSGRLLFEDTSTGRDIPLFDPRQPHLVRLAFLGTDDDGPLRAVCHIIRPDPSWPSSTDKALSGHGVSEELAQALGVPLDDAMAEFREALEDADELVAFNISFHTRALRKAAVDQGEGLKLPGRDQRFCAMREATQFLRIPRETGYGYQWPKLVEAYAYFSDGKELPPIDDPIETGLATVGAIRVIREGIAAQSPATNNQRSAPV